MKGLDEAAARTFAAANEAHHRWTTRHRVVGLAEERLVAGAFAPVRGRVLDVGCGHGATLHHLGAPEGAVGLEPFEEKLELARREVPRCTFVAGSAYALPFEDGSFDEVLVRDVLHHLDRPAVAIREIARVLAPGGALKILEPNRYNPLVLAHALTNAAERGELRSTARFLSRLVEREGFAVERLDRLSPLPVHRLVFHPELGSPALAERPSARGAVAALEAVAESIVPRGLWAYIAIVARTRPA